MARLLDQIREALAAFRGGPTDPVLIGGLALAAHQVVRATQDVDFLVDADDADRLNSSQKPAGADQGPRTVLIREGGVRYAPGSREDPFEALFELMEVVEALCPEWPVRKPDTRSGTFLL